MEIELLPGLGNLPGNQANSGPSNEADTGPVNDTSIRKR